MNSSSDISTFDKEQISDAARSIYHHKRSPRLFGFSSIISYLVLATPVLISTEKGVRQSAKLSSCEVMVMCNSISCYLIDGAYAYYSYCIILIII